MSYDDLIGELLGGAWDGLNAAAGDLLVLASAIADGPLANDARLLADAVERELDVLVAIALRASASDG